MGTHAAVLVSRKAVDRPEECLARCQGWRICFETQDLEDWKRLALKAVWLSTQLEKSGKLEAQLNGVTVELTRLKNIAIERGQDEGEVRRILEAY